MQADVVWPQHWLWAPPCLLEVDSEPIATVYSWQVVMSRGHSHGSRRSQAGSRGVKWVVWKAAGPGGERGSLEDTH